MNQYDVLIIGGGHNGLVCACYLARAGRKVLVLEARNVVGGAAVTEEFHPGFRNSVASYTVSLLHPRVIAELRLADHGLRIVLRPMSNFLPLENGDALRVGPTLADTVTDVRRFSARDADSLKAYYAMLERLADELRGWMGRGGTKGKRLRPPRRRPSRGASSRRRSGGSRLWSARCFTHRPMAAKALAPR